MLRRLRRLRRGHLALRHLGEHLRDQPRIEDLVDGGVREARVAEVDGVLAGDQIKHFVLAFVRVGSKLPRVVVHRTPEGREVVELAVLERPLIVDLQVGDEPFRELLLLRELPDRVDAHHVLESETLHGPARDRRDRGVLGERGVCVLSTTDDRDCVDRQREAPREISLVVRRCCPRENLVCHAIFEDVTHRLQRLDRVLAVDRRARVRVLDEGAVALHQRDQQHVRVELVRHPEPDRMAERLQLRRSLANVVPSRRLDPDLIPEILAEVNRIWDVVLREPVPLVGPRVVTALESDLADPPDLTRDLLNDLLVVDHLVLEPGLR